MPSKTLQEYLDSIRNNPDMLGVEFAGVHTRGVLGDTPLHIAAVNGDVHIIGLLLDAGADIDAHGEYGYTPLQQAVGQGHVDAVRLLLRRGASRDSRNDWGKTAKEIAQIAGKDEIKTLFSNDV
jgi:uncharacterized protein